MDGDTLKSWRKGERERLIRERSALDPVTLERWRHRIRWVLGALVPRPGRTAGGVLRPIRNEYDARHLARTLRERGSLTALPVVVAPRQPLVFREWHPGVELAKGALDIPYPIGSREVVPEAVLLPMNGWDPHGYRLGYGAGFFDRTLASLAKRPVVIGISYELARLDTIHPQPWDVPVDYVVTERGVYRRDPEGLVYLGEPQAGDDPSVLSSPVCYAGEVKRER